MRLTVLRILTVILIVAAACGTNNRSVTIVNQGGQEMMMVNINRIRDSVTINLSDIADSLRFIPLETLPECLISQATYYLTNRYILARTKTAIYQFDIQGKFIRALVSRGEGPMEFMSADWAVDEMENRLILSDEPKTGYFMQFDLQSGAYLGDIPKAIPSVTRRLILTRFGSLACVPYLPSGSESGSMYLYWQDLKGNLIDKVIGPADLSIFRGSYLESIHNGYRYMLAVSNKDTIYSLIDKRMIPYIAFEHGEPVPEDMESVGYRNMKISLETSQFLFFAKLEVSKVENTGQGNAIHWNQSDYVLDKKRKVTWHTSGIYSDFIGTSILPQSHKILPNGIIFNAIQSMELIGIAERTIADPKSNQKLIWRMEQIRAQIDREDNPVLVVGKVKN